MYCILKTLADRNKFDKKITRSTTTTLGEKEEGWKMNVMWFESWLSCPWMNVCMILELLLLDCFMFIQIMPEGNRNRSLLLSPTACRQTKPFAPQQCKLSTVTVTNLYLTMVSHELNRVQYCTGSQKIRKYWYWLLEFLLQKIKC